MSDAVPSVVASSDVLGQKVGNNEEEIVADSSEQAEAIDDYEAAVTLKKSRGRRVSRNVVASKM
ncbi:hypothetical protein NHQ30_011333 [Ciborinia camelliae]|nr:hypothetical protein NHQ30_011333 [Ciborinia camelliae]